MQTDHKRCVQTQTSHMDIKFPEHISLCPDPCLCLALGHIFQEPCQHHWCSSSWSPKELLTQRLQSQVFVFQLAAHGPPWAASASSPPTLLLSHKELLLVIHQIPGQCRTEFISLHQQCNSALVIHQIPEQQRTDFISLHHHCNSALVTPKQQNSKQTIVTQTNL